MAVEASELLEIFQWTRGQHDWREIDAEKTVREHTEEELADILLYLIRFASLAKIDLQQAALRKMEKTPSNILLKKRKDQTENITNESGFFIQTEFFRPVLLEMLHFLRLFNNESPGSRFWTCH